MNVNEDNEIPNVEEEDVPIIQFDQNKYDYIADVDDYFSQDSDEDFEDEDDEELKKVKLHYDLRKPKEYSEIFSKLTKHIQDHAEKQLSNAIWQNIEVMWEKKKNQNQKTRAYFDIPTNKKNCEIVLNDRMLLVHYDKDMKVDMQKKGKVIATRANGFQGQSVYLEFRNDLGINTKFQSKFTVKQQLETIQYERMSEAVAQFIKDPRCISPYLRNALLGDQDLIDEYNYIYSDQFGFDSIQDEKKDDKQEDENKEENENGQDSNEIQQIDLIRDYYQEQTGLNMVQIVDDLSAPNLAKLNASQSKAVHAALTRPLSLIQGPPGTGKTVVSATIVYHWVKMRQGQILVCAPSNVAADNLTEKIAAVGLKIVRFEARYRESIKSQIETLTLGYQVRIADSKYAIELHKLQKIKEEKDFDQNEKRMFNQLINSVEKDIISKCDVICCTLSSAGDDRLKEMNQFNYVLIDESTQSMEPETLISFVKGAKHVVLVGDQNQLGPIVQFRNAANHGLSQSLFERLILLGISPIMIQTQYRMHPEIALFPSMQFYDGKIQNGVTSEQRSIELALKNNTDLQEQGKSSVIKWPNPDCPIMFLHTLDEERKGGTSYANQVEANSVFKILKYLLMNGISPDNIAVITPYRLQIACIKEYFDIAQENSTFENGHGKYLLTIEQYYKVQIDSVDAFQGREKDFIIFSCVRSNDYHDIGFLRDPRRLNVALTRAKYGLIILGNAQVLSGFHLWNNLLVHLNERNCLVQGTFTKYKPAEVTLKQYAKINPIHHYIPPDMPKTPIKEQQKPEEPTKENKEQEVTSHILKDGTTKDEKAIDSQKLSQSTAEEQSQPSNQEDQNELTQNDPNNIATQLAIFNQHVMMVNQHVMMVNQQEMVQQQNDLNQLVVASVQQMLQPLIFDLNLKLKELSDSEGGREWQIITENQQREKYKISEEWNMIETSNQKEMKK
ncbi:MAG: putative Regulator of nonsense transcripts 1 [Streblomastix strix]|uniref:Putative Regulator of nonsense transcripts 1 n=1 Tax=Streblomastix strix TaxID=222440 RepID=A0A5J4VYZ3_9EUKA|nr:MAG: putative Regulator of nonsense transcripts 1 [Streblomastix strix]